MPFRSGREFAGRHNKKLTGKAARGAAEVANKALARGEDEGTAIREANAVGDRLKAKADRRYRKRD